MPVRVLVAEDGAQVRGLIEQAARKGGNLEIVATADDTVGVVELAKDQQPDVVILDLGLPELAGREVLTRLNSVAPAARVLVYSGSETGAVDVEEPRGTAEGDKEGDLASLLGQLTDARTEGRAATIRLEHRRGDIAEARRFVEERCQEWGCEECVDEAALIVSELVSNAFRHARSDCVLRATYTGDALRLDVTDFGIGTPEVKLADVADEGGRGLYIVGALSNAWGTDPLPGMTKVVWAVLGKLGKPVPAA